MPIYALNMTHAAVSCPIFNEEVRKKYREAIAKREEVARKHNVRVLVACVAVFEHIIFHVLEAPSQSAVEEYVREVGLAFYNNIQIREVQLLDEEALKRYGLT